MTELVDHRGQPLRREVLKAEIAAPTLAGVRQPIAGYPADGMNPARLAGILRQADAGDPLSYFELAEQIEERDLHYLGVLGTRKRAVTQVEITVEAASDDPLDVAIADRVRGWLKRDELADELFDILDAVGKGDSFTEIVWDISEGQYQPARLEWRDPRFFRYANHDGRTPLLRGGESGRDADCELPPWKFIRHTVKAKSGLPVRSGIARVAAWAWMFKAFTQRDWAIFTQTYGQPIRLGRFDSSASPTDRQTLWRAVANIAGDCAALIPKGMEIEFIQAPNVQAGAEVYERRADWLDRQISKGVLGQTGTTDSKSGGIGDGGNSEHGDVRQDIKRADCRATAATLNRDLVRPWVQLEYGPRPGYPRLKIEEPEAEDLQLLSSSLAQLVPLGLRVKAVEVRSKLNLSDPAADDELLRPAPPVVSPILPPPAGVPALQSAAPAPAVHPVDGIADQLAREGEADVARWFVQLRQMMQAAGSFDELREMIAQAYPVLDTAGVAARLAQALATAGAAGMSDVEDASG